MEFGLFEVDKQRRIVRGILIPWNEESRVSKTKNAPLTFRNGDITVPRDHTIVSLNREHDRYDPFGRGTTFEPVEAGLYSEFRIADTDEGDEWLTDHGDLVRLSPELRDITRHPDGTATATLTGAALVTEGAFASAGLFAIDDDTTTDEESATDPAEAEPETTETDEESAEEKEEPVGDTATVPGMLANGDFAADKNKKAPSKRAFFRMVDDVMGGRATLETRQLIAGSMPGESGMFALNDVDFDGTDGVGAKMVPSQWIGEIETLDYQPLWYDLFPTKALSSLSLGGWKWGTKPAGGTWAGNKAPIPTNTPTVVPVTDTATRWAGGHDIAREHRDFGTPGFFESYNREMRLSYEQWKDTTIVRTELLAGATDIEADNPTGLTIGAGWSALIDGAAQLVANGFTPTFAVVELSLWKTMMKVPNSDTIGYLEAALNLESGSLSGFTFRPGAGLTTGHIIVGSRQAAEVYELPGVPIRAEALNIANGGIDIGFFGYAGFLIKNALGIIDVAPYTA
jgi:hypothetical protein